MINLRFDRHIDQPIEVVFARLVDIDAYHDWLPRSFIFRGGGLTDPESTVNLGSEFTDKTPFGTFHGRITELKPPTRVAFEQRLTWLSRPVFDSRPSYVLERVDDGTRVVHRAEGQLYGIYRLGEPLVRRLALSERSRTVDELKRSLEQIG